ncbi:unnamed protein product [Spodoptera littoralis]|uniref:Uncharacterized protein n=1 Tax=Spodoptera littoralis TaxID=7109 RepID=A0A9P0I6B2_SPOLI|nr:unnamed protein product [Spodoptera littoralis]CAH1642261.1 unnamed protein product [Spodoptera littoralis]
MYCDRGQLIYGKNPPKTKPKMYYVYFNLHVRAAKRVRMIINKQHINFTYDNKSSRYDGYANYIFVEKESIYATCLNAEERGKVQLIYSKTVSFLGVKSKAVLDSTSLTINLHMGLNNSYLDCEYISVEPNDKYNYRVYFITEYVPSNLTQLYTNGSSFNIFLILGCISGLLLIITIVGIVYWRKRQRPTKDTETPYNDLQNENEMTPIPESMYDSCFSENFSDIQSNNDVLKSSDNSEPYYHSYEKVNYSQCKPKLDEPQQRASKIYNEPYDHFRKLRSKK